MVLLIPVDPSEMHSICAPVELLFVLDPVEEGRSCRIFLAEAVWLDEEQAPVIENTQVHAVAAEVAQLRDQHR